MADISENWKHSSSFNDEINGQEAKMSRLTMLMERLRNKHHHQRSPPSWGDMAKTLKMSLSDKRHILESVDKSVLHKHLETLQNAFKDLSSMVERLEHIAKQNGLKFMQGQNGDCFLSSDMFFLQVSLENNGGVKEVKVSNNTEVTTCPELAKSLSESDFEEFTQHIKGLSSISAICSEKKQKSKLFLALQSLETDLNMLSKLQSTISSVPNYIHKSPLGIHLPRIGGLPMKMIYFVGPYDLLNGKTKSSSPMTVESIIENKVGYSVTVGVESSVPNKLQTIPLMTVSQTSDGKSMPSFTALSNVNSSNLPAVFVLNLEKPVPVSLSLLKRIQDVTGLEVVDKSEIKPLSSLLVQQQSKNRTQIYDSHTGLHVSLPDQNHCYFLSCLNGSADLQGALVTRVPFLHPTSVPHVLLYLRQQVLFNTVLGSCVRNSQPIDVDCCLTFEVTPVSLQSIIVTFEHPSKDTMATAELDLSDITAVKCCVNSGPGGDTETICPEEHATKVLQRCLSIPITMRAVLQKAKDLLRAELLRQTPPPQPVALPSGPSLSKLGQERRQAFKESHVRADIANVNNMSLKSQVQAVDFNHEALEALEHHLIEAPVTTAATLPPPPPPPPSVSSRLPPLQSQGSIGSMDKVARNPMLASLLDQETNSPDMSHSGDHIAPPPPPPPPRPPSAQNSAPMLSALLGNNDSPSTTTQMSMTPPSTIAASLVSSGKQPRKPRKRRSTSERSPVNKTPKRKPSEDEFGLSSIDFEPGSVSPFDMGASSASTHPSANTTPTLTTPTVNLGNEQNPFFQESHVSRLASSLDNIIKQESKNFMGPVASNSLELTGIVPDMDMRDSGRPESRSSGHSDIVKLEDGRREGGGSGSGGPGGGGGNLGTGAGGATPTQTTSLAGSRPRSIENMLNSVGDGMGGSLESDVFTPGPSSGKSFSATDLLTNSKSVSLSSSSAKMARMKSQDHDPFDFNPTIMRSESSISIGSLLEGDDIDMDLCDRKAFGSIMPKLPVGTNASKSKANNVQVKTEPSDTFKIKMEEDCLDAVTKVSVAMTIPVASIKEENRKRKRENRESMDDKSQTSTPSESKPPITVKLNKKILKESPLHKTDSPDLLDLTWRERAKDGKSSNSTTPSSTPNSHSTSAVDLTADSEVEKLGLGETRSVGGGSISGSGQGQGSPRILTGSLKRSEGKEKVKGEKRKRSSKHSSADKEKRRKVEEIKREQLKKQKIYDFDSEMNESENFRVEKGPPIKPTTIKITKITSGSGVRTLVTTSTGKSPSRVPGSSSGTPPMKIFKSHLKDGEKKVPSPKLMRASQKAYNRSKSEPQGWNAAAGAQGGKVDSAKLTKNLSIKLKPLNLAPGGTTVTVTVPSSSKAVQSPSSAPVQSRAGALTSTTSSTSTKASSKALPVKSRKGSLSAVIDKLTKQHNVPPGFSIDRKEGGGKKDPISEKDRYDAIRLQIIREGNKPSTPTKEVMGSFKSSQGKKFEKTPGAISSLKTIPKVPKTNSSNNSNAGNKPGVPGRKSPIVGNVNQMNKGGTPGGGMQGKMPGNNGPMNKVGSSGGGGVNNKGASVSSISSPVTTRNLATDSSLPLLQRPKEIPLSKASASATSIASPPKDELPSPSQSTLNVPTIPLTKQNTPPLSARVSMATASMDCSTVSVSSTKACSGFESSRSDLKLTLSAQPASSLPRTPNTNDKMPTPPAKSLAAVTFTESPASPTPENRGPCPLLSKDVADKSKSKHKVEDFSDKQPARHFLDAVIKLNGSNSSGSESGDLTPTSQGGTTPKGENGEYTFKRATSQSPSKCQDIKVSSKVDGKSSSSANHGHSQNSQAAASTSQQSLQVKSDAEGHSQGQESASNFKVLPNKWTSDADSVKTTEKLAGTKNDLSQVKNLSSISREGSSTPSRSTTPTRGVQGQGHGKKVEEGDPRPGAVAKVKSMSEAHGSSPILPPMPRPRSVSPSPQSTTNTASNSEDKENKGSKGDEDVFKAPTPKAAWLSDDKDLDGRSRLDSAKAARTKSVLSPRSDISSPEDGLIIDVHSPATPRDMSLKSPASHRGCDRSRSRSRSPSVPRSPATVSRSPVVMQSPAESGLAKSPANHIPKSPSTRKPVKASPGPSPSTKSKLSGSSPLHHNSPSEVDIDDDLMDAALGIG